MPGYSTDLAVRAGRGGFSLLALPRCGHKMLAVRRVRDLGEAVDAVTAVLRSAAAGLRSSQLRVRLLRPPVRKRSVLSTPSHAENFTFRHTDRRAA